MHPLGVEDEMSSIPGQNCTKAKDVKNCSYCWYVRCVKLIVWEGELIALKLGLSDKGWAIKGLVVCNLEPLVLINGMPWLLSTVPYGIIKNKLHDSITFELHKFCLCPSGNERVYFWFNSYCFFKATLSHFCAVIISK